MKRSILSVLTAALILSAVLLFSAAPSDAAVKRQAIIIYHNDWGGAPNALKTQLQGRGYTVTMTDNATTGLAAITTASNSLVAGDFLVVYLAGHGYDPRYNRNDVSKATALGHFVQFNSGNLYVSQSAPLFEKIANKGVSLSVLDGSCNGGEAVLYAMGQKYCAMSTTGVYSPGLTGFPSPASSVSKDSAPGEFGLWWDTHLTASWLNGEIVKGVPERINQRLFRNDKGDMATLSIFLRPNIGILTAFDLGGWNLHYMYCYLFRFIYPDDYAALDSTEKSKFTNSAQTYITTMRGYRDPADQFFTKLSSVLSNSMLLNQAASVYSSKYTQVWQTLANDPSWNVNTDPGKYAAAMKGLTPDAYKGEAGFMKLAGEIDFLMTVLKTGYQQQEDLLKQIDAAAKDLYTVAKISDSIKFYEVKKAWPPAPGAPVNRYNLHERNMIKRVNDIERRLKVDRSFILSPVQQRHAMQARPALNVQQMDAKKSIDHSIELYKNDFKTQLGTNYGISAAALNAMKKQKLEELIGKFKAVSPTLYYAEGRISFLLSIVEDAVSKVQGAAASPCDTVKY